MEGRRSYGFNDSKKSLFSIPEEDVSSTKNKSSSSDGQRRAEDADNPLTSFQLTETAGKPSNSPPFVGLAAHSENLSATCGDITSPQAISVEPMRGSISVPSQAVTLEQGQPVIAGLFCWLKYPWLNRRSATLNYQYPTEETSGHDIGGASQPTKHVAIGGPYLNEDGTFKDCNFFQGLETGTIIYASMESVYYLEKGELLGERRDVFQSKCGKFILKCRKYCKNLLDDWKQLPYCDNVMPLIGVLKAGSGYIYQVTERMDYDLRQARKGITLTQLASSQSNELWQYHMRNISHIFRSILIGAIHLNCNEYQHYDLKEENIFVNKPHGCHCNSILECTCSEKWIIKIGDFDTLGMKDQPTTWICGTKYYRPPECEGKPKYEKPTYDSWSILVMILHFCCGTARSVSDKQAKDMPWLKNQECHYAYERFKAICMESTTNPRLFPLMRFAVKCLEVDHKKRPTPEEMLRMWDML